MPIKSILKEFDKEFVSRDKDFGQLYCGGTPNQIKEFITKAIKQSIDEIIQEEIDSESDSFNLGYNQCIKEIKNNIKEL